MLKKLYILAETKSKAYAEARGELTKDPIATEEISVSPEDYQELLSLEQTWWNIISDDVPNLDGMTAGVAVGPHTMPNHMLFVGTYQVSLIFNEMEVKRMEGEELKIYPPNTIAKIVIYDYKFHPDRVYEYFVKNVSAWSMTQCTTGFGLAFLKAVYDQVNNPQPKQGPPMTPVPPKSALISA